MMLGCNPVPAEAMSFVATSGAGSATSAESSMGRPPIGTVGDAETEGMESGSGDPPCEPQPEICNGIDDDCDDEVDEGLGQTITCGQGICAMTIVDCNAGMPAECVPGDPNPNGETCDQTDDDCDGRVDEDCACTNGATQACYTSNPARVGMGECANGMQTCAGGAWGDCDGEITPVAEVCDNLDNDCNGEVDQGNPGGGGGCGTGLQGVCQAGTQACLGGALECEQNVTSSSEACNLLDDDCDGMTDEGNPGGGGGCDTGLQGICQAGTGECLGGSVVCVPNQGPAANETCGNGLDDDCNGMADDGCGCPGGTFDCDGNGGCECTVGNGCCGAGCQTEHNNGAGQNFYDCEPLNTYNLMQAIAACAAYTGDPGQCADFGFACDQDGSSAPDPDTAVVCGGGNCRCWGYAGVAVGYVYNNPNSLNCACPIIGDPQWN